MAKYIDADLLRKEIEKKSYEEQGFRSEDSEYGYRSCARDLLAFIDYLQQEQRETDVDDRKFVKILVRKEFAEQIQRLGDEIQAGQSSFIEAMNQQEQQKEICSKCIHHGKDDDYCYNPYGGMRSLINENGVYECTGFYEQEQPRVDLDNLTIMKEIKKCGCNPNEFDIARHFFELGQKDAANKYDEIEYNRQRAEEESK